MTFFLSSCSTNVKKTLPQRKLVKIKTKNNGYHKATIGPGEVLKVEIPIQKDLTRSQFTCRGLVIPFWSDGKKLISFVSESYFTKKSSYVCRVGKKSIPIEKRKIVLKIAVKEKKFPFETLNVDKKRVFYSKKDMKRILGEQKKLNEIYNNFSKRYLFQKGFRIPLKSKVTSIYGTQRIFNKKKKSQHLGIDYRARVGTPIHSSNSGKVVLSKNLFFTGNTVILDHGLGLFTVYGHLSKMNTTLGEYVPKNALLGLAGKTGRVTGPHLHWGTKIHGHWIDGNSLVSETKIE
jgi:murein DD-endopeptidase MepM/ murein hydrolase activator NlpD